MTSHQQCDNEQIDVFSFVPDDGKKICPVTVSQIVQAFSSEGHPSLMEGKNVAVVSLVAHVACVRIKAAGASLMLEDGTGKIWAEKPFAYLVQQLQGSVALEAEEEEVAQFKALEHTYVETLCELKNNSRQYLPRMQIVSIHPVHGYHQVMYHILNVIYSNMLSRQHNQPCNSSQDLGPHEHVISIPMDDGHKDDSSNQQPITSSILASFPVLPNTFAPQKHQPYATLKPLERAIMKYMCCHRPHQVLITELAPAIQASCECTELQFNIAFQALLSEAYLTSPLDDGYIVITPRHQEV